jgi:hypothetical protein
MHTICIRSGNFGMFLFKAHDSLGILGVKVTHLEKKDQPLETL